MERRHIVNKLQLGPHYYVRSGMEKCCITQWSYVVFQRSWIQRI